MLDSEVKVGMIFKGSSGTYTVKHIIEYGHKREAILQPNEGQHVQIGYTLRSNYGFLNPGLYQVIYPDIQIKEIDWI